MSYLYPYGDTQQLNLSWFLAKFKELYEYIMNLDPDDIALATVLSRFTNEYNSSMNYIPGDYTIHEGFIYKANQSTTGNFNPEAWGVALPVNDIQGLRILLGGMSADLTALEQNAITNVQYTPGAASADGLLRQTKNGAAETVMTVDKEPTANSQNPVKSGAVQAGIAAVSQAVGSERTDRQNADTSLQNQIDDLNDITGDGSLSGFTATDLTGAANELKNSLGTAENDIDALQTAISAESVQALLTANTTNIARALGQIVYSPITKTAVVFGRGDNYHDGEFNAIPIGTLFTLPNNLRPISNTVGAANMVLMDNTVSNYQFDINSSGQIVNNFSANIKSFIFFSVFKYI